MRRRWLALPTLALALAACGGQAESTEPSATPTPTVRMVTVQVGGSGGDSITYTDPSASDRASTIPIEELVATTKVQVPAGTTVRVEVNGGMLPHCFIANASGELALDNGDQTCSVTVN